MSSILDGLSEEGLIWVLIMAFISTKTRKPSQLTPMKVHGDVLIKLPNARMSMGWPISMSTGPEPLTSSYMRARNIH